ncbi:SDR family oxidoreductase [Sphingomonas solaris]|uniref:SDR family oxidoreductase n=1 Tax=Alterirhizorhabdus solaris TaxID=2529389 RepID=A0A558RCX8_9SPHN|nr:SDR family oxidoreductase [Sphingomonas solaris]TVV77092.1 SDR family oxidoreductase [Sphingomonas solaris]
MTHLQGKIAVVTGASAGIGAATVRALAEAGAVPVLVARRAGRLEALMAEIGCGVACPLDLADEAAPSALVEFVLARFGRVDLVIHNAGILHVGTYADFDPANLRQMIAVNYESIVRSSHLFARAMRAQGGGQIINISSIGAGIKAVGTGIYGGLKQALETFTDVLRVELAGSGIKVGLVAPGTTSTEIFEPMKAQGQPGWDSYIPALRPEDVARAVMFMADQPPHANVARLHVYSASEGF